MIKLRLNSCYSICSTLTLLALHSLLLSYLLFHVCQWNDGNEMMRIMRILMKWIFMKNLMRMNLLISKFLNIFLSFGDFRMAFFGDRLWGRYFSNTLFFSTIFPEHIELFPCVLLIKQKYFYFKNSYFL